MFIIKFEAMGTHLQIRIWDNIPEILQEKIKMEILNFTEHFDKTYSRFRSDSFITKIYESWGNNILEKKVFTVEKSFLEMLEIYEKLNEITHGKVNPFIGQTISDLGYDAKYSLRPKEKISQTPNFKETFSLISPLPRRGARGEGFEIKFNYKVLIDFGAVGKGFWVDKVCEILKKNNLKKFLVDGSGDMFFYNIFDDEKLEVNLEGVDMKVEIFNQALCGSGINLRNWSLNENENLHHVINANENAPTDKNKIKNTWVKISESEISQSKNLLAKYPTAFCDGLATCLFFEDAEILKQKLKINFWGFVQK